MTSRDKAGPPVSPELAALSARLRAGQQETDETPAPKRDRRRVRRIVFAVLRWTGVGFLSLTALVLFALAGTITASNQEDIAEGAKPVRAAQARIYAAQDTQADLPETAEATRWLTQAREAGQQVAGFQNVYLVETGPVSLTGIPKVDPDPTPGTRPKAYTTAQRQKLAEERRERKVSGLGRSLEPYFEGAPEEGGFNPVSRWQDSVSTLDTGTDDASLAGYTWSFPDVYVFQQSGTVDVVWELRGKKTGRLVGWVNGTYDPESKTFADLRVGTAAKEAQ